MIYFVAAIAAVVSLVGVRADRHERCCCLTWHATESMTNSQRFVGCFVKAEPQACGPAAPPVLEI